MAQLLFCVQCPKPTSLCHSFLQWQEYQFLWLICTERSPQLELPMQLPPGCSDSALTNQIPPESEDQHITGCHSIIMVHFGRKRSPERTLWPPAWNSQKAPTQKSSYIVHATVKLQPSHNVWAHPKFKINVPCNEHILLQSRWSDFFFLFCSASLISWLTFNVIYCH